MAILGSERILEGCAMKLALCMSVVGILAGASLHAERPLPKNLSGDWIRFSSDFNPRANDPLLKRFISSISPWAESGGRATVKLTAESANVSGSIYDNERIRKINWIPESYAIGITGKFEFYSFIEP